MIMISVIIPACNEEKYIGKTISSVRGQNYKKYEIIVVCDGCTDSTVKLAGKLADRTIILKKRVGPAIAKNKGAIAAAGDKLIFLDADTRLSRNAMKNIEGVLMKNPNLVGTFRIK